MHHRPCRRARCHLHTDIDGLDIIPSHIDLVGAEIEMLNLKNREKVIKTLLPLSVTNTTTS